MLARLIITRTITWKNCAPICGFLTVNRGSASLACFCNFIYSSGTHDIKWLTRGLHGDGRSKATLSPYLYIDFHCYGVEVTYKLSRFQFALFSVQCSIQRPKEAQLIFTWVLLGSLLMLNLLLTSVLLIINICKVYNGIKC